MKKGTNLQHGFTLIELLIYMGLFSILLVSLVQLFGVILEVKFTSEATSSVTQDGRYIIERLNYDIHRATSVVVPVAGAPGNQLHIQGNGLDYQYSVVSDDLMLTDNSSGSSDQLNSNETRISNITFTKLTNPQSDDSVKILFTVTSNTKRSGGRDQVQTFQTSVKTQ